MNLTILGTGNATVTHCYNTCFVLDEGGQYLLVDGGGGNGLLQQLEKAQLRWQDMRTVFVTHKHMDHLLGILWLMRMMGKNLLSSKDSAFLDDRLHLVTVADGETRQLIGRDVTFFDIRSTKAKQFGFSLALADGRLTCCGDEPYQPWEEVYVRDSKWLLHEAFCLDAEADIFHPYEKHHSTVKDACETAARLGVQNLILYHTEDKNLAHRRQRYHAEGCQYYQENLYIPDDLDVIRNL